MDLESIVSIAKRYRSATMLLALVTTFAGVALIVDRPHDTLLEWLAIPLLVSGVAIFAWAVWPVSKSSMAGPPSIATRFLYRATLHGRLARFFPLIGIGVIVADIAYNLRLSATPALQTEDTIVLLAAGALLGYGFVPDRFARERDFVLLFFFWINAILVVPLLIARLYSSDFDKSVDLYSWVALAPQASGVLSFLGVPNVVHAVSGSSAPGLSFTPQRVPVEVTVVISTACSGIYSFGTFAAAFVAFVMTEFERLSRRVWALLGLGLIAAYAANVLRMVVIVLIGYYTDSPETELQNMLIAHSYAGWLIFLGWLTLFWGGLFKFLPRETIRPRSNSRPNSNRSESTCGICSTMLKPAVLATRCSCGAYYHWRCLVNRGRCPTCFEPPRPADAKDLGSVPQTIGFQPKT